MNYRIGLDYAHSTVYFDIGRTFNFPDFDVIGLILRSEHDGSFAVAGVADFDGKSSLPGVQAGDQLVAVDGIPVAGSTLGQVWSMLEGLPGQWQLRRRCGISWLRQSRATRRSGSRVENPIRIKNEWREGGKTAESAEQSQGLTSAA
jgi:hypothetical protein